MLKLKLQYFGHLMRRVDSLEKTLMLGGIGGRRRRGREDEMAGWHHWFNGHESEWTPGVGDGQGVLACCDSWGRKKSDTTERLNWTELASVWDECNCAVVWTFFDIAFLRDWNENWPFPALWSLLSFPNGLAYCTFTASSFRIWNSSTGIPSPPLALFIAMLPKAHLTSHSRMSGSSWVITPLWLYIGRYGTQTSTWI